MNPRLSIDIFFICNFEHLPLAKNDLFMVLLLFHSNCSVNKISNQNRFDILKKKVFPKN